MKTNQEQKKAFSLTSHITELYVNLDGLYYNCSICGNVYDTIDDLTQHADIIHGHSESSTNFARGGSPRTTSWKENCLKLESHRL